MTGRVAFFFSDQREPLAVRERAGACSWRDEVEETSPPDLLSDFGEGESVRK